jgi:hypothetical protein
VTDTITTDQLIDWLEAQTWSDFAQSLAAYASRKGNLSEAQEASARSMYAKCAARAATKTAAPTIENPATEPGFYCLNDTIYRLRLSQAGNLYALRLLTDDGLSKADRWQYTKGITNRLSADDLLTAEKAAELGRHLGICCMCGDTLEDKDGLGAALGIGPHCIRKYYGKTQRQLARELGIEIS